MQNDKGDNSRIQKAKASPYSMPTLEDIMENKASAANTPVQDTDKKEFVSRIIEKISRSADEDFSPDVPSFNLGQQILAQQRKIAAFKRKSPLQNDNSGHTQQLSSAKVLPIQPISETPASPQQKIIAEIIAREIHALTSDR